MTLFCISVCFSAAAEKIELSLSAAEKAKLPERGTPSNENHYNTFEVTVSVSGLKANQYYDIEVKLEDVSEYPGYAANYKSQSGWDMKFDRGDYPAASRWAYEGKGRLYLDDLRGGNALPKIKVRCYDWGGSANVKVILKEGRGVFKGTLDTDSISIPADTNNNGIADAWEDAANTNNNPKKVWDAAADDEDVPKGTYSKGDGWSVYREYRGVFLKSTDTEVTRLDPNKKDVLICYESATLANYGTGAYSLHDSISIQTIENHADLINNPFEDIHVRKKGNKWVPKKVEKAGWVNKHIKNVPGAKDTRVWAIRVIETSYVTSVGDALGDAYEGSPSYYSVIRIHTKKITGRVEGDLEDKNVIRSAAQRQQDAAAAAQQGHRHQGHWQNKIPLAA